MRILLTTDTVGGVWTFTRELTEGLLQQGHKVALASLGRLPSPEQSNWTSALCSRYSNSFFFFPLDGSLEWMQHNEHSFADGEAALSTIAGQFAPDLLHSNQFCFGAFSSPMPRLITAHSDVLSWAEACRPQGLEPSPWLERYQGLVQRGLRNADAVVAPTQSMLVALRRNFSLPARQHVIANGRALAPSYEPQPTRALQAVTAGRLWDEAKNIRLLAQLNSPLPLVVAGEQDFAEVRTCVEAPSLRFTGALPEEQLLQLFRSSAIYITPSIYEPFGLAPLEAALCGCAILANDLPSFREVWGEAALYFTDAASLEHHLRSLAHDSVLLATAQARAQLHALTYSRDAMTTAYLNLYRSLAHTLEPSVPGAAPQERQRVA